VVLVDSSIWIDYFCADDLPLCARIDELIRADEAAISGLILGEVLYCARSQEEYHELADTFGGLHCLVDDATVFSEAADLAWQLRAKGIRVPLSDLTIAIHCRRIGAGLLSRDRHFALVEEGMGSKFLIRP
jgi:predicted nucleic acid-binding protein